MDMACLCNVHMAFLCRVSDYRFIDSNSTSYVPYVPIVIVQAGYEFYAQIIISYAKMHYDNRRSPGQPV